MTRTTLLTLITLLTSSPLFAATPYVITDLGTTGGPNSYATKINDSGQIIGSSYSTPAALGAFYYSSGAMTDLGQSSLPSNINNKGEALYQISSTTFLYFNGTSTPLPFRSGYLNDSDQFTTSITVNGHIHAAIYDHGTVTDLTPNASNDMYAELINNHGQVLINTGTTGHERDLIYSNGSITGLGTLEPNNPNSFSQAYAMNDLGQVVGISPVGGIDHLFLYSNGTMADLGNIDNSYILNSRMGINNAGQIVGTPIRDGGLGKPFIVQNGIVTFLDWLIAPNTGWSIADASDINNFGQIVGTAMTPTGDYHACILTPATPGDANTDGVIDITDLNALGDNWQSPTSDWFHGDFNNDGKTDISDLNLLALNWQLGGAGVGASLPNTTTTTITTITTSSLPEPTSLSLLAVSALFIARRKKS